jgi:hypothetical protein
MSGLVLHGYRADLSGTYPFVVTFSEDCNSFSGTWGKGKRWTGTRART